LWGLKIKIAKGAGRKGRTPLNSDLGGGSVKVKKKCLKIKPERKPFKSYTKILIPYHSGANWEGAARKF